MILLYTYIIFIYMYTHTHTKESWLYPYPSVWPSGFFIRLGGALAALAYGVLPGGRYYVAATWQWKRRSLVFWGVSVLEFGDVLMLEKSPPQNMSWRLGKTINVVHAKQQYITCVFWLYCKWPPKTKKDVWSMAGFDRPESACGFVCKRSGI